MSGISPARAGGLLWAAWLAGNKSPLAQARGTPRAMPIGVSGGSRGVVSGISPARAGGLLWGGGPRVVASRRLGLPLDLDRRVGHVKLLPHEPRGLHQHRVGVDVGRHREVGRQRHLRRARAPDIQVGHRCDAGDPPERCLDRRAAPRRWPGRGSRGTSPRCPPRSPRRSRCSPPDRSRPAP